VHVIHWKTPSFSEMAGLPDFPCSHHTSEDAQTLLEEYKNSAEAKPGFQNEKLGYVLKRPVINNVGICNNATIYFINLTLKRVYFGAF